MNFEEAFKVADDAVFAKTGKHLNDVEETVIRGTWEKQTYEEMAGNAKYTANYLQNDVGPKLWKLLSEALGEKVNKKNCRVVLQRRSRTISEANSPEDTPTPDLGLEGQPLQVAPEFPDGQVGLNSTFYVERPPIESRCYEEILQPASLIRIKAPRQMGKTSLMARILAQAAKQGYRTVILDLSLADGAVLTNLDKFLCWFCASVGRKLQLPNQLDDYWDEELLSSNSNCTVYFEEYLLAQIDTPLALGLDEVDRVFPYPEIAPDFFRLLRNWHENGKNRDIWKQLRLVVAHSTEVYIPLNINQSPFNVGLPVELPEWSQQQVQELAKRHGLDWSASQVEQLMAMVGGHPFLVRLALYHVARQNITLDQLLQTSPTEAGIYGDHLRRHLANLQENLELKAAFKKVVATEASVNLEPMQVYQLQSMGLVQLQGNDVTPRCNLYRRYFRNCLSVI